MGKKSKDERLKDKGVRFLPWIGKRYDNSRFGVRILVLGESHYGGQQDDVAMTREVVEVYTQGGDRIRFFTVIANVLRGQSGWIEDTELAGMFQEIAFYNFVQTIVGEEPRCRPTFRQWVEAQEPFKAVLTELKPDVVLVLGVELQEKILEWPEGVEWAAITHPAGALRYAETFPKFHELVDQAKANKKLEG